VDQSQGALRKDLGTKEVFAISAGAMISSGLFILPAIAFTKAGPAVIVAYLLASLAVIPAMLSKAELATAMPRSGGVYFFVARSFGVLFGLFTGFASWFSLSLKSSFALLGIGIFLSPLVPQLGADTVKIIAIGFTVVFTLINLFSVKETGRLQFYLVIGLLAALLFFIVIGAGRVNLGNFTDFAPSGWLSVLGVTGLIFVSFGGLTKIASVAEEVRDPGKSIPRGMFGAFAVVSLLYLVIISIVIGVLPGAEFRETLTPISTAAQAVAGRPGFVILAVAAMLAFITTANAGLLAASRNPLAMARDGLIPHAISRVNKRFNTPVISVLLTSAFMITCIVFLSLEDLVKVASTMKLLMFTFVNFAVIFMRESGVVSYKPLFKTPLYPYLQIAGIVMYLGLIAMMGTVPLLLTAGFFVLSGVWYLLYARKVGKTESAFFHMVGNLTNREIVQDGSESALEGELLSIMRERDEIEEDRFDRVIRDSAVIDMDRTTTRDEFFRMVSEVISERWKIPADKVAAKFAEREAQTSTLIYPGVAVPHAIPHIIIPGEHTFDIVLVRNKFGIVWNDDGEVVYTAFCLVGTKDERNFHLKALMSIAQVLQDPDFHTQWMKARSPSELRAVMLVAERKRD
jgi:basic amino acid/polyamine antiporter, APA family